MKKLLKNFTVAAMFMLALSLVATPALANDPLGFDYTDNLGLSNTDVQDPRDMAVNIVQFFMTFLGIIAVVIILLGGFKWMTAAGNEDKVAEAKKLLIAGIIGLAIIISAYVIVNFVITTTNSVITNGTIQY
jgi:heme/copper-type cytochrome/quinol oxidase subunit 2